MVNDAKYKSCLTLILAAPSTSTSTGTDNSENISVDDKLKNQMIPNDSDINSCSVDMNQNQLSHKMNRTFVHGDSFNQSIDTNETIIPIKCASNDENNDSNQLLNIDAVTETSPKYCCTLEVKFVWYGNEYVKNI